MSQLAPQERVLGRTQEEIVGVPVLRIVEAAVDVVHAAPQERLLDRSPEQIVYVPVPLIHRG